MDLQVEIKTSQIMHIEVIVSRKWQQEVPLHQLALQFQQLLKQICVVDGMHAQETLFWMGGMYRNYN
jgi:hypothetical protein